MTKSDLIEALSVDQKIPMATASGIVNAIIEAMVQSMVAGDNIELRGFGSFTIKGYESYEGRNPKTGVRVQVKPKRKPVFRVGKDLKEAVLESGK